MKDKRNSNWALQEWADFNLCEQFTSYHYLTRIRLGIKDIKAELWLLQRESRQWSENARQKRGEKDECSSSASWLILFFVLLSIQVCLANFLILRLRMKPYSMK